ncbi:unnamed protein product [Taenia asiatica]|uniref:Uncharacterized protein n=1 Tax=Taenia asiatica TaxID=60517 RepID=A0A0R3WEZ1_TAEAS|nr:unnamed protein product [Taenia asiatica]
MRVVSWWITGRNWMPIYPTTLVDVSSDNFVSSLPPVKTCRNNSLLPMILSLNHKNVNSCAEFAMRRLLSSNSVVRIYNLQVVTEIRHWELKEGDVWCSGVDWIGLDWIGLDWSGVKWSGVEWSGVGWSGVEWSGVEWSGVEWSGVEWSGVEWRGVEWSGVEWSGVEWSGVEWSGVEL